MSRHQRQLLPSALARTLTVMALLSGPICLAADQQPAPESASARSAGHWVEHKYRFHAMTFTSTYSCNGLMDKLRRVLRTSGARVQNLMPLCSNGYGRPDRLAQVDIQFSTLQPGAESSTEGAAAAGSAGTWKRVQLAPQHPYDLQSGDCELIDQFRSALLPMFAVRDIKNNLRCIPNQDSGPFSLTFEVFAPAP